MSDNPNNNNNNKVPEIDDHMSAPSDHGEEDVIYLDEEEMQYLD